MERGRDFAQRRLANSQEHGVKRMTERTEVTSLETLEV